jgi:transposase
MAKALITGFQRIACTLTGAEHFAAIRSYTATATRQGIGMLDALITAAAGTPWIPTTA